MTSTQKTRTDFEAGKGVLSIPDDDAIRRWLEVPVSDRLRWLEEVNEFLYKAQPPRNRAAWEAFRKGEI